MSDSDGVISQLEALLLQLPESDSPDLNPPDWPHPQSVKLDAPPAPSPFEDYQLYPFHWTGESLKETPVELVLSPPSPKLDKGKMLPAEDQAAKLDETSKPSTRKRRFKHLRRAMSLSHIRHKPTPPDTAPPTPTVPHQVPSVGVKSLESLTHWQLPDPTAEPTSLDGNLIVWPSSLAPSNSLTRPYHPIDQLSPPSSIPSESDILPRNSLVGLGIYQSTSPHASYPPTLFDSINLSDPAVLGKDVHRKVVSGTVEGLVAYITSPDCLDYDILSDFFMMYRKFMDPRKLLGLLCARFEWGLIRGAVVKPPDNEGIKFIYQAYVGMVRVRTFAALRHWLLNYFADDFAPSPSLRSQFVASINSFGKDERVKSTLRDTRIIAELKRCWRRVCRIYWDTEGRGSTVGGLEGDITLGGDKHETFVSEEHGLRRVPSLLLRATREREQRSLGVVTSRSQPDLRRRFIETARPGTVNSTRPAVGRGHTRIHSTSTLHTRPDSQSRHRRNASDEPRVIYSKNSNPALYQSFARGDGRDEWPPVMVRADILVTSPKGNTTTPSRHRQKRKLFRSKRKKIAVEGAIPFTSKSSTSLACGGQLSDDEEIISRRTRRTVASLTSEPVRDRVDFLAAGMWASFISAASSASHASVPRAEELGEALVQGYIHPMKVDDEQALAVAVSLDKGKDVDIPNQGIVDVTMTSSDSQIYQTTLSMSEIERRMGPITTLLQLPETPDSAHQMPPKTRPPSLPLPETPDSFRRVDASVRFSNRFSLTPTPPLHIESPDILEHTLRRRPGGNLRNAETVKQLHPRPTTVASFTSSISSYSLALIPDRSSNLAIPSISTESPQSFLETPRLTRQSHSPAHRMSGLGMDFSAFRIPQDIESSDDSDCDPADAVEKTLLKLEGRYVRKSRHPRPLSESDIHDTGDLYELALSVEDPGPSYVSERCDSPPEGIMIEMDDEARWARRHQHVVDGQTFDTPTRHDPFIASSLFDVIDSHSINMEENDTSEFRFQQDYHVDSLGIPLPTVESALAELERDRLEHPRIPTIAPPKPPEDYHRSLAAHLPFILQYDSTLLARQFTLIEKDILGEIDWAELIEPTWMDRNPEMVDVRDWKGFIVRDEGEGGLDTVVARFNLMAGWTTSEIILTQSIAERRLVISKFIHIAAACQRLHNYATLTQIVMGLQSQHVSALTKTWEALNSEDMSLWNDLQNLVDSRKNWSKMRYEMDSSCVGPRSKDEGCIPFVGIFMSDLVHVTSRPLPPGKIDFEGLRLRASIVKKTLRMIELAEEYRFTPEPGVGERCLWITAFDEPMLRRIAAGLE